MLRTRMTTLAGFGGHLFFVVFFFFSKKNFLVLSIGRYIFYHKFSQ